MPSAIGAFAVDRADLIGCDPAAIVLPALVTCGAVLPGGMAIQPKAHDRTWREAGRLWALVVAPPAAKKSPALEAAGAPAFEINSSLAEHNAVELREYEEAAALANGKEVKKGLYSLLLSMRALPRMPQINPRSLHGTQSMRNRQDHHTRARCATCGTSTAPVATAVPYSAAEK